MIYRVCAMRDCDQLISTGRFCASHIRQSEHGGVSASRRGYGAAHQALRARLVTVVARGTTKCARCHRVIAAGESWDLGHTDGQRSYSGPEHRVCNRSAAGKRRWVA